MTQPANKRLLTEDQASPLSSTTPVAGGAAAAGSSGEVSRSDHVHPPVGLYGWYGDGSDGDLNFDGTNTFGTASKSGNVYTLAQSIYADDMVVGPGVTVRPNGNFVNVRGTLSGSGIIEANPGKVTTPDRYAPLGPGGLGGTGGTGAGGAGGRWDDIMSGSGNAGGAGGLGASGAGGAGLTVQNVWA